MSKKKSGAGSSGNPITLLLTAIFGPLTKGNLLGWLVLIVVILGLRWIWFEPYKIPSGSMEPTLNGDARFMRGDRVFINKHYYGVRIPFTKQYVWEWHDPQRWEIVVFKAAHENPEHNTLIKRVVGLPGERIHIKDGALFVNGEEIEPPGDLKNLLYYTSVLMAPREQLRVMLAELAWRKTPLPSFVHWDDKARDLVLEMALTGNLPNGFQLNPASESSKQFMADVDALRAALLAEGVTSIEAARESDALDDVAPISIQLVKEWLIMVDAPVLKLPSDANSPLFVQDAVIETEQTIDGLRDQVAPYNDTEIASLVASGAFDDYFATVSGRTWRVLSDLFLSYANQQPRNDLKYGLRTEDEYAVVPDGHYLLLGDNSGNSLDGRVTGWVPRGHIIGRAFCIWWPVGHWKDFTGFSKTWWGMSLLYGLPTLFVFYTLFYLLGYRIIWAPEGLAAAGIRRGTLVLLDVRAYRSRVPFTPGRRLPSQTGGLIVYMADGDEHVGHIVGTAGESVEREGKSAKAIPADKCAVAPLDVPSDGPQFIGAADIVGAVHPLWGGRPVAQRA